jgi:hypothetical protein
MTLRADYLKLLRAINSSGKDTGGEPLDLSNWTIADETGHDYYVPFCVTVPPYETEHSIPGEDPIQPPSYTGGPEVLCGTRVVIQLLSRTQTEQWYSKKNIPARGTPPYSSSGIHKITTRGLNFPRSNAPRSCNSSSR